jgi:ankyrin repeat protein
MIRACVLALAPLALALSAAAQDNTAILMGAAYNGSLSEVRSSLKDGAGINTLDENGETALMYSVSGGHDDISRFLLDKGAAVDALSSSGETALFYAALKERPSAARLLLERGAKINAKNANGDTPLMIATSHGSLETAKILLDKGADLNAHGGGGSTALMLTISYGQAGMARLLIEHGAEIEARDDHNATALNEAAIKDSPEIARLLIEKGADVNARDSGGATPLSHAAYKGRAEIARMLIDKGADVNIIDTYGETPLQYATAAGNAQIAKMIEAVRGDQADRRKQQEENIRLAQEQAKAAEASAAAAVEEQRRQKTAGLIHLALAAAGAAAVLAAFWIIGLFARRRRSKKSRSIQKDAVIAHIRALAASDPLRGYESFKIYESDYGDLSVFSGAELLRLYEARDKIKQSSPENMERRAKALSKAEAAARVRSLLESDPRASYETLQDYLANHGDASVFFGAELGRLFELCGRAPELLSGSIRLTDEQAVGVAVYLSTRGKHDEALRLVTAEPLFSATIRLDDGCGQVIRVCDGANAVKQFIQLSAGKSHEFQAAYARAFLGLSRPADCLRMMAVVRVKDADDHAVIAAALAQSGKLDEAVKAVEDISKAAWSFIGWSAFLHFCLKTGRWEEAREAWEHFHPLRPLRRDPQLHYALGLAAEAAGRADLAGMIFHPFTKAGLAYKDAFERAARLPKPPEEAHRRAAPEAAPSSGTRIGGRYDLRSELGRGDLGTVFVVFDSKLGRKAALKKIRPEIAGDPKEKARFLHEAKLLSRLEHPAIVGVREIIEEGGEIYLVFDFAEGEPLSKILSQKKRLALAACKAILEPVCQALDHAHLRNFVHGAITPGNIMVDAAGRGSILDLGLARVARAPDAYSAPEAHRGSRTRAGDVYSLGVCLFEMTTGQLPFSGAEALAHKEARKHASPHSILNQLPREMDALFASALAPDPKDRIADALEFFAELKRL